MTHPPEQVAAITTHARRGSIRHSFRYNVDFVLIEPGNGERFPMEPIWAEDSHVGFRFIRAIDATRFISEPDPLPPRALRLRIEARGEVHVGDEPRPAMLINLSQNGACIETGAPLAERQPVRLTLAGLPERLAYVRWRKGFAHGLVFQQGFRLDELARYALVLQPIAQGHATAQRRRA